jgi:hypothetical protein
VCVCLCPRGKRSALSGKMQCQPADHAVLSLCVYLNLRITANMRDLSSEDRRKMLFGSDILVP